MKRTPEQAAKVAAWLNMLEHVEAQLQGLGALPKGRAALREAREQNETFSYNLKTLVEANRARQARAVARGRKSLETIAGLEREVARLVRGKEECDLLKAHAKAAGDEVVRLHNYHRLADERSLELLALAQMLGCDCVPHKMIEAVKALKGEP